MSLEKNLLPQNLQGFKIHFVGIKGTGMAALVEICYARGAVITGSDVPERFYTDAILEKLNIKPFTSFSAQNVADDVQLVIYSSAYKLDQNPDLIEARRKNIPILLYTQALGEISALTYSCGVAGVHGKTTTTGLVGTLIKFLNLPAQVLAGSIISSFDDKCTLNNGNDFFVAETCEYQRHFMAFHPQKIILTSVESDHEDYYPTYESIRDAFVDYAKLLPAGGQLIYCADEAGACEVAEIIEKQRPDVELIPYGVTAKGDYQLTVEKIEDGKQYFRIAAFDGDFYLKVPGIHLLRNATAACALACELLKTSAQQKASAIPGMTETFLCLKNGFASFCGAKRRSEIISMLKAPAKKAVQDEKILQNLQNIKNKGILVMDDYAHHPTAIKTTLEGLRLFYPDRRIIVDFMSHTYSRTAALLDQFAASFSAADVVILHKIYPSAREKYDGTVNGKVLFEKTKENHKNVVYYEEILDALPYVKEILQDGDLFITMGAGDNWKIGKAIVDDFEKLEN